MRAAAVQIAEQINDNTLLFLNLFFDLICLITLFISSLHTAHTQFNYFSSINLLISIIKWEKIFEVLIINY